MARSRQAIVDLLKAEGPSDSRTLASQLKISTMAARQHLYALRKERLVTYAVEARPIGRPAKVWRLAPAADCLFPDGHADLSVGMIEATQSTFGRKGLARWIASVMRREVRLLKRQLPARTAFGDRLQALAGIRSQQGYMARVGFPGNDDFLLIENHCPIRAAASACEALCDAEREIFQEVLGPKAVIERTEHIATGARRCVYVVRERAIEGKATP